MSLDGHRRARRTSRGKRVGTAGLPYQSAYLQTILAQRRRRPRGRSRRRNVGFNLVPAMLSRQGRRDARRVLELRGRGPPAPRAPAEDPADGEARRADLRRARSSSPAARTSTRASPRSCGASCAPPRAATSACARTRSIGVDALLKVDPGPRARAADRGRRAPRCRSSSPRTATKPFGWQEPSEWDAYGRWMYEQQAAQAAAGRGTGADQRVPAGRGAGPADDRRSVSSPAPAADDQVRARQALPLAVALEEPAHLGLVGARLRVAGA